MKYKIIIVLVAIALAYSAVYVTLNLRDPILTWDWSQIDANDKKFSKGFVWGAASAAHQVEGGHQNLNNFGRWEQQTKENGEPTIVNGDKSGDAVDNWRLYKEDTQLMTELGLDGYRFSVSWSKIMPRAGEIDQAALQHYVNLVDELLAQGIQPMITLHHFTHPIWFEDLGGFEKQENIEHFVKFSEVVFNALQDKVKQWCTINEPGVYMYDAYLTGMFPPGKQDPLLAAQVLENLMRAHVQVYRKIKSLPGGEFAQVGIVKNMMQVDAHDEYNLLDQLLKFYVDGAFNESILEPVKSKAHRQPWILLA